MRTIVVQDYDPAWPDVFAQLRSRVWLKLCDVALTIEHVGSTSVPGLAAKPIIDMSVVVPSDAEVPEAIRLLALLGYVHCGNLGIRGREAFVSPEGFQPHNLYLCPRSSIGLENHLAVRDYLRTHPVAAKEYGDLKKRLAEEFPNDIDSYVDGKTDMIARILRAVGFSPLALAEVEQANRK